MARRRVWTDHDKATALAAYEANDCNVRRTARQLGIPKSTLARWANGQAVPDGPSPDGTFKKNQLADELEKIAYQLIDSLPDKIQDASLQQTATSLGIVIDKMNRLRGEPTEISDHPLDFERITGIMALLDLARARQARGDPPDNRRTIVDAISRPTDRGLS